MANKDSAYVDVTYCEAKVDDRNLSPSAFSRKEKKISAESINFRTDGKQKCRKSPDSITEFSTSRRKLEHFKTGEETSSRKKEEAINLHRGIVVCTSYSTTRSNI